MTISQLVKDQALQEALLELEEKGQDASLSFDLVMLIRDQIDCIPEVLDKVRQLDLDHLHLIDTGSTYGTLSYLAKQSDICLHQLDWQEDYGLMRNLAVQFSQADWVLVLDSDEVLETTLIDFKRLIKQLSATIASEFAISFEVYSEMATSYTQPVKLYRPRHTHYIGKVHEELRMKEDGSVVPCVQTAIRVHNSGKSVSEVQRFDKERRYTRLVLDMLGLEPDNPRWVAQLSVRATKQLIADNQYEKLLLKHLLIRAEKDFQKTI